MSAVQQYATIEMVGVIVVALGIAGMFTIAMFRASNFPPQITVVIALSVLTFIALIGAILNKSTDLVTLAGVGIGALGGAVSSWFDRRGGGRIEDRAGGITSPGRATDTPAPPDSTGLHEGPVKGSGRPPDGLDPPPGPATPPPER